MEFNNLEREYKSNAEIHFINAQKLIKKPQCVSELLYAALEYRLCIERLCFEYLVLVKKNGGSLSKSEEKMYQPKVIMERVLKHKPELDATIVILNEVCEMNNLPQGQRMISPDIKWLIEIHGKLGNWLHLQIKTLDEKEVNKLLTLLLEIKPVLKKHLLGRGDISDYRPHVQMIIDKYLKDEVDLSGVKRMIRFADIPEHLFN